MRITRRLSHAGAVLTAVAATLLAAAGPATAAPAPVETNYQNPVSALPPVSRPATAHCTVTAMRHDFANSYGQPFVGTLTPPGACPGPWSKVVLDWSGSVAGRQYDRLAGVWIGGAEVFRTSTPEPDPAGISWHVDADISRFIPLLRTAQPLVVDLGNIVNSTYTGIYHLTLTVTYYQADRRYPPAATADQVVPVSQGSTTSAGWWSLTAGQSATQTVTFPRNLSGAQLEVFARGGGCEEFWYTNVPDAYNQAHPGYGLCGGGPYREVRVEVDGVLAGVAQPFPAIYSGGISPLMWRPIMSVDSLRTQPYAIDLTPFAGLLSDGQPHRITLLAPTGITDVWTMDGTLFLTTDHHRAHTGGGLLTDTISAEPTLSTSWTSPDTGTDVITTTASRDWTVSGFVDTSRGRVVTTVRQHLTYSNADTVKQSGDAQSVVQKDSGYTQVGRLRNGWSYPISVTSVYQPSSTGSGFLVRGSADVARIATTQVAAGDDWPAISRIDDHVTAQGVLQRDDSGTVVQADGSDAEDYYALSGATAPVDNAPFSDDAPFSHAGCYHHLIEADHGYVTTDRYLGCRGTLEAR